MVDPAEDSFNLPEVDGDSLGPDLAAQVDQVLEELVQPEIGRALREFGRSPEDSAHAIARAIRIRMEVLGLSVFELAEIADLAPDVVQDIIDADMDIKDFGPISSLEQVLKVSLRHL